MLFMLCVSHTVISAGTPLFISGSPAMEPDIIYTSLTSTVEFTIPEVMPVLHYPVPQVTLHFFHFFSNGNRDAAHF